MVPLMQYYPLYSSVHKLVSTGVHKEIIVHGLGRVLRGLLMQRSSLHLLVQGQGWGRRWTCRHGHRDLDGRWHILL